MKTYMKEMGTVKLLSKEEEINISKNMENNINNIKFRFSNFPIIILYILKQYNLVINNKKKLLIL
ncbi:sigma-70 factor domain-containing protein [Candidatus Nardonella dryophthoridicola]|nr:sigma-70 factor domain-containing protein [Candidatus Nardonella dryophthoridicola]